MGRTPGAIAGLVLAVLALVAVPPAHAEPSRADWSSSFHEGLRMLEANQLSDAIGHFQRAIEINPDAAEPYTAIRLACGLRGRTIGQVLTETALIRRAHEHLQRDEGDDAEKVLTSLVRDRFANPEPHLLLHALHTKRGGHPAGTQAGKIFNGLLAALLASGDGKSRDTAFLVQGIAEEHMLAGYVFRCRPSSQAVQFPPSGGVYDVLNIVCADGERSLWFDVSAWGPEPAWRLTTYRRALKKPD